VSVCNANTQKCHKAHQNNLLHKLVCVLLFSYITLFVGCLVC
jgi:hypothetical protein